MVTHLWRIVLQRPYDPRRVVSTPDSGCFMFRSGVAQWRNWKITAYLLMVFVPLNFIVFNRVWRPRVLRPYRVDSRDESQRVPTLLYKWTDSKTYTSGILPLDEGLSKFNNRFIPDSRYKETTDIGPRWESRNSGGRKTPCWAGRD